MTPGTQTQPGASARPQGSRGPLAQARRLARRTLERLGLMGPVYRAVERRIARRAAGWASEADGLPVPPPYLVTLVASDPDLEGYLAHGRHIAEVLAGLLARQGRRFDAPGVVLDFGCGCGRVARRIAPTVTAAGGRFVGLDIRRELVAWCAGALPGEYLRNAPAPPASLPDASVDVLYAVSVFTHLPQARMEAWLAEYARLLKPGGVALVSFADEGRIAPEHLPELEREGVFLSTRVLEGSNYMSSYITAAKMSALASRFLHVAEVAPSAGSGETLAWLVLRAPA